MYSDGVTETFNGHKQLYSLIGESHNLPAQQHLDAITADVKRYVGRARQSDDITCGVIWVL